MIYADSGGTGLTVSPDRKYNGCREGSGPALRKKEVRIFCTYFYIRKSSVVGLEALYGRGEVDTPVRIRVA